MALRFPPVDAEASLPETQPDWTTCQPTRR